MGFERFGPGHDASAYPQLVRDLGSLQPCFVETLAPGTQVIVLPERVRDDFGQPFVVEGIHEPMLSRERAVNDVAGGRVALCWLL